MNKVYKIHAFYILLILISIIIILIAIKWGEIENLVNLISFALTISSLVLAILAIIYAVYSNNSFSSNIAKLDSSSDKINSSAIIINNLSNSLVDKIDQLPIILNSIEQKTDATQIMLSKLNFPNDTISDKKFDPNEIDLENFVFQNSTSGQTLLYILYMSFETKKHFNLKGFCEKYSFGYDYYYGFFVAVQTLRIIKYDIDYKDGEFSYTILEMNSFVKARIKKLVENIRSGDEKTSNESLKTNVSQVEEYFK